MTENSSNYVKIGDIKYLNPSEDETSGVIDGFFREKHKIKVRKIEEEKTNNDEVEAFKNLRSNPNVQRLFAHKLHDSIHYFGLQSFDITLKEFMEMPEKQQKSKRIDPILMIKDIVNGLKFLHDQNIIHGNMSFSNIGIIYKKKQMILCNCGFDDLQEDIFISPEESPGERPSKEADIFNLGCIVYYILSYGIHPFGSLDNPRKIIENIKSATFECNFDFSLLKNSTKYNYKAECANSLLKGILSKNPKDRPDCNDILDHPLFWSNHRIYDELMDTNSTWKNCSSSVLEKFPVYPWTKQLKKFIKGIKYNSAEESSIVELVHFITSKIKHYEDELDKRIHSPEHLNFYLNLYPDLLIHICTIQKNVMKTQANLETVSNIAVGRSDQHSTHTSDASSMNINSNALLEYFIKKGLHVKILSTDEVKIGEKIANAKPSNAEVFHAVYANKKVVVKKVKKMNKEVFFDEIESFYQLVNRTKKDPNKETNENSKMCDGCGKETCKYIIGYHGCYEELDFYCLVLEKAEMTFGQYIEKYRKFEGSNKMITKIFEDAVKGLYCLHKNNISHLDIKPENILIVNRGGEDVGCLADFGISIRALRKTITNLKVRGTEGYMDDFLLSITEKDLHNKSIEYHKCDIFSLGMVLIKDCIGIKIKQSTSTSRALGVSRSKNEISSACEQLASSMIGDRKNRPDAEGVLKDPFFWKDANKFLSFLQEVDKCQRQNLDSKRRKAIESDAIVKLFTARDKSKTNWVDFLNDNSDISKEILKYVREKIMDTKSIFDLVNLILIIPTNKKEFPLSNKILKSSEFEFYLNFWLSKFDLITFLYYTMQNDIVKREFYPADLESQTKVLRRRSMLMVNEQQPKRKRKLSIETSSDGIFVAPKKLKLGYY